MPRARRADRGIRPVPGGDPHRHRVDREVPADQVVLEAVAEADLRVWDTWIVESARNVVISTRPAFAGGADGAEFDAGIPQRRPRGRTIRWIASGRASVVKSRSGSGDPAARRARCRRPGRTMPRGFEQVPERRQQLTPADSARPAPAPGRRRARDHRRDRDSGTFSRLVHEADANAEPGRAPWYQRVRDGDATVNNYYR